MVETASVRTCRRPAWSDPAIKTVLNDAGALDTVAAAACRRVRKLMADADLPAWLDDLPRTAATGEVFRMRGEYGTCFA